MAKVNKNHKRANKNTNISIKNGYFGLRIKGSLPQSVRKQVATMGSFWSAYSVEEYFELREERVNIRHLSGWYYSSDIIILLNNTGINYRLYS